MRCYYLAVELTVVVLDISSASFIEAASSGARGCDNQMAKCDNLVIRSVLLLLLLYGSLRFNDTSCCLLSADS